MLKSVTFWDIPSGTIATVALGKTAEMSRDIYPKVTGMILKTVMFMILSVLSITSALTKQEK